MPDGGDGEVIAAPNDVELKVGLEWHLLVFARLETGTGSRTQFRLMQM